MKKSTFISELDLAQDHVFLADGQSYILPKGKVGKRDSSKRLYLCWQESEGEIYYICSCGRINRMSIHLKDSNPTNRQCGVFLDRSMVGTFGCEYCSFCKTHVWYVLKDFPVKTLRKKIAKEPRQCPICEFGSPGVDSGFWYCGRCSFHWRLSADPVKEEE